MLMILALNASKKLLAQDSYANTPLSIKETEKSIKTASESVDYSDEKVIKPEEKKPQQPIESDRGSDFNFPSLSSLSGFSQIVLIVLIAGLFIFIAISLAKNVSSSKRVSSFDAETEEFAKLNLEDPLQEELGKGNYRLASRILYLKLLQEMVKWRAILWRNEKTNWDYYKEAIKVKVGHKDKLYEITHKYDHLWYGEKEPSLEEFKVFESLINKLIN